MIFLPERKNTVQRSITTDEIQLLLLKSSNPRQRAIIHVFSATGCRPEAIADLKIKNISEMPHGFTSIIFYAGHFNNYPVTPGVILTECMAQIGLVCFGFFLLNPTASSIKKAVLSTYKIALTNHNIDFYLPVFPGERVRVLSHKEYFRFSLILILSYYFL